MVRLWENLSLKINVRRKMVDNKLGSIILENNDLNSKLSLRKVEERVKDISNNDISHSPMKYFIIIKIFLLIPL